MVNRTNSVPSLNKPALWSQIKRKYKLPALLFTGFPPEGFTVRTLFRPMSTILLPPLGPFTTPRWSGRSSGSPLGWQGLAAPVSPNYTWWGLTHWAGLTGCWLNTFWTLPLHLFPQRGNYLWTIRHAFSVWWKVDKCSFFFFYPPFPFSNCSWKDMLLFCS